MARFYAKLYNTRGCSYCVNDRVIPSVFSENQFDIKHCIEVAVLKKIFMLRQERMQKHHKFSRLVFDLK